MLPTLIFLTILFVLCLVSDNDFINALGFTGLLLTIIIGWGVIACMHPKRSEYYTVQVSKSSVTLSDNSFLVFYIDKNNKESFDRFYKLSDLKYKNAKILKISRDFNMYGFQIGNDYISDVVVENLEKTM